MCLETISQVNGLKDGVGYKVFEIKNGRPYGFMQGDRYKEYEVEKWLHERKFRVVSSRKLEAVILSKCTDKYTSRARYCVGFHIFRRKKDALKWCACGSTDFYRVSYRKAVASGKQFMGVDGLIFASVVVAKEIKLHEVV